LGFWSFFNYHSVITDGEGEREREKQRQQRRTWKKKTGGKKGNAE